MTGYYSKSITISELIKSIRLELLETLIKSKLDLDGIHVSLTKSATNGGGERLWFKCPACSRRCGVLRNNGVKYVCNICIGK